MTAPVPALADFRTRVEYQVVDTGLLTFTEAQIDEGIRQALADINLQLGQTYTVKDLDSASTTTITAEFYALLVQGSAGYAVQAQIIKRLSIVGNDANQRVAEALQGWAKNKLYYFTNRLEQYHRKGFAAASTAPYSTLAWDEDDGDAGNGDDED